MTSLKEGIGEALLSVTNRGNGHAVPSRIETTIQISEELSEVLVRLLQLAVIFGLGVVFFLSPEAPTTMDSQVPMVIGAYLVFTLVALFFAARGQFPIWLVYLSILVDIILLTYLIFSFHLQYEQPASFSLKSPSFLLYFVLIALRALRFDYRYVLVTGIASIIAWVILVVIVTRIDPYDSMITRDYVTYLTSNTVLIGAEVDKMITVAVFTAILSLAVYRARLFFVSAIIEAQAATSLARFMPDDVADHIRDSDTEIHAGEGTRRTLCILNIDIRGFSELVAEMEPQSTMNLLSDYQSRLLPIIHAHHGVVDKFMGDGIMVIFGLNENAQDFCADAIRCVDDIVKTSENWTGRSKSLNINLALATGQVVHGAVGSGDRLEFTVIGPAVNQSAKLEKFNKIVGSVAVCDVTTWALAQEQGLKSRENRVLKAVEVPGIAEPLDLVVLV